ncbi:MAG: NADH:flavin oxidoreductase [Deltaproteobacteria bacterium]|nr:NADH:flavin oxidoreductase [Deltaproteobacteria bacterium]
MELRNRFVRSATGDGCAESGYVTPNQIKLFDGLASGGVGLIITGVTYVNQSGQINPYHNSAATDDCILPFRRLTDAVHYYGAKIALQLVHAGRERANWFNDKHAVAPSVTEQDPHFRGGAYREITEQEIEETIFSFGRAAKRAKDAGFDAVQVHAAHSFLLSQFLSPFTNHRLDQWGGPLENRIRIHSEICRNMRKEVGDDFPLLIKFGVADAFKGGLEFSDGLRAAMILAQSGFDALEISQGLRGEFFHETEFRTGIDSIDQEGYFKAWAAEVKKNVSIPVMAVGGFRTFELMEDTIRRKEADYISLCRPFIREPDLVNVWERRNHRRSKCISCNECINVVKSGQPLYCPLEKEV